MFKKEKHKTEEEAGNPMIGDAHTFVAIEAKSKLILCYELGKRDGTRHWLSSRSRESPQVEDFN
jgi:hypothetical protein